MGRYHVVPSPSYLPEKENILGKETTNDSYIHVDKAGFYHHQGHYIRHEKYDIFLFPFLSFPWQCTIRSILTAVLGKWRYL